MKGTLVVTGDPDADVLLNAGPLALLVGIAQPDHSSNEGQAATTVRGVQSGAWRQRFQDLSARGVPTRDSETTGDMSSADFRIDQAVITHLSDGKVVEAWEIAEFQRVLFAKTRPTGTRSACSAAAWRPPGRIGAVAADA